MKRLRRILLVTLVFSLVFFNSTSATFASELNSENIFSYTNIESAVFPGANIQDIIVSSDHMKNNIKYIDGILKNNELLIKIGILDESLYELEIPFNIFPSQLEYMNHVAIIGKTSDTDSYKILSMRIEKNASNISLLKPNLNLEGHTVFSLAIRLSNEKIYYLQIPVDEINFEKLTEQANLEFAKNTETKESLIQIEENYFALKGTSGNIRSSDKTASSSAEFSTDKDCETSIKKISAEKAIVSPLIPDSVFKSGVLNKMTIVDAEKSGAYYTYAYYQSYFAGTQNRITDVVLVDRALGFISERQLFYYNFIIKENGTVLYNAYNNSIHWQDQWAQRITISDIKLKTTNDAEDKGIAYMTKFDHVRNETMVEKILKVGFSNIPKVGPFIDCFMTLTSNSDTSCRTEHRYQDTYDKQVAVYGKPIRGVSAHFDRIKSNEDSVYEEINGRGISRVRWFYSATFTYN